ENLIPGGRKSVATTASSRVWTRRNRYPTTNSNRSAPWTLERLTAAGESMRTGPPGERHVQHLVSVDSTARRLVKSRDVVYDVVVVILRVCGSGGQRRRGGLLF